jgi:hypothetical protein
MATFLVLLPLLRTTLRTASATSSNFSMLPSVIQPRSSGSMAQRCSTSSPLRLRLSSTSLTLDELTSMPSSGAGSRLNNDPSALKVAPKKMQRQSARNLRFHFNASSKLLAQQRFFVFGTRRYVVKSIRRFASGNLENKLVMVGLTPQITHMLDLGALRQDANFYNPKLWPR